MQGQYHCIWQIVTQVQNGTIFKHTKGRNGSTSFLPLRKKGSPQGTKPSEMCLTKEQAEQIYDKIEAGEEVKIRKIMQ